MVSMEELLNLMVQRGGSDLHISVGSPPRIRIDGKLIDTEYEPLMPEATKKLVYSVLGADQVAKLEKKYLVLGEAAVVLCLQRDTVWVHDLVPPADATSRESTVVCGPNEHT